MKKILVIVVSLLALAQLLNWESAAQDVRTARDLYVGYDRETGGQHGRPGVKVSIRLRRNGKERWASVDEKFYNGDHIKLSLETNFAGYVAVINTGTTGKRSLLYPQADDAVFPANGATLPPAQDKWIVFDNNSGEERVALIFAATPLGLPAQRLNPPAVPTPAQTTPAQRPELGSTGGITDNQDAQTVLAELNSRAINRGRDRASARDMITETIGADTYSVASQATLSQPVGFEFVLRHGKH